MSSPMKLTQGTIKRLRDQGYTEQTEEELSALAFGNRFAYQACTALLVIGVYSESIAMLSLMLAIAFLGVMLPNHPFDYIYNYILAPRMDKPQLPKRSNQLKFACGIATVSIGITIYLFASELIIPAFVLGGVLIAVAFTVGVTDYCLPSTIYNALFLGKEKAIAN